MAVRVGTSGYNYPEWRGSFYPASFPTARMLPYYAERFDTVEINYTFYRMPSPKTVAGWAEGTPAGFTFALKASRRITHDARLRDVAEPLRYFLDVARGLGPKLGPLLFQLPPYFRFDAARLADFLGTLPHGLEPTFEFRHESWFNDETYDLLGKHRAALCIAEADDFTTPPVPTAPFGYLRLRRADYGDDDLDRWAARVRDLVTWKRVYVYFKHEESGRGPALARAFLDRLR